MYNESKHFIYFWSAKLYKQKVRYKHQPFLNVTSMINSNLLKTVLKSLAIETEVMDTWLE